MDLLGVLAYGELTRVHPAGRRLRARPHAAAQGRGGRPGRGRVPALRDPRARASTRWASTPRARWRRSSTAVDSFHERTKPSTWLEGLVKAYVGDGIATDFYREIAAYVDPSTQALVHDAMQDVGQSEFVVKVVREAIKADRRVAGRLALWGRRLVG